ncbi:uncharacterized protein, partial [Parasteatoda tepidariorum]|uniref:uncharacterized protein n=1 Tax=Parasteatoda tepidariorum TaxID=114398 RepID=UPI0039BC691C
MNRVRGEGGRFHSGSSKEEMLMHHHHHSKLSQDSQTNTDSDGLGGGNGMSDLSGLDWNYKAGEVVKVEIWDASESGKKIKWNYKAGEVVKVEIWDASESGKKIK